MVKGTQEFSRRRAGSDSSRSPFPAGGRAGERAGPSQAFLGMECGRPRPGSGSTWNAGPGAAGQARRPRGRLPRASPFSAPRPMGEAGRGQREAGRGGGRGYAGPRVGRGRGAGGGGRRKERNMAPEAHHFIVLWCYMCLFYNILICLLY